MILVGSPSELLLGTAEATAPRRPAPSLDQDQTPYVDALRRHAERDTVRLHVPGHKGGTASDSALVEALGPQALALDLPKHIRGVDVGDAPTPLAQAQRLAADAWGSKRTWFLTNGASQGNQTACLAMAQAGTEVVVQGNVHSSIIDGLILSGLRPRFVNPELDADLGIAHTLSPDGLALALDENPGAVAAFVVSPTYYGVCADLEALAAVAHDRGVPLIVDEAWGAHLAFHPGLPVDGLSAGADLVISSTHKVVGSLTQSAMLHLGHGAPEWLEDSVARALLIVESTSTSSLLLASLDAARRQAAVYGRLMLDRAIVEMDALRDDIRAIPGFDVLDDRMCGRPGLHAYDRLTLAIDVTSAGLSGYELDRELYAVEGLDLELVNSQLLVALFGMAEPIGDRGPALVAGLRRASEAARAQRSVSVALPGPDGARPNGHRHPNGNGRAHTRPNGNGRARRGPQDGLGAMASPLRGAPSAAPQPDDPPTTEEPPVGGSTSVTPPPPVPLRPCRGPLVMSPRDAFLGPREVVPAEAAIDRIAAEALMAYPPGIPAVLPGERLTEEILTYCRDVLDRGGRLRGANDPHLRTVMVVVERHDPRG